MTVTVPPLLDYTGTPHNLENLLGGCPERLGNSLQIQINLNAAD